MLASLPALSRLKSRLASRQHACTAALPVLPQADLKDKARNLLKYRLSANRRSPHGHISDDILAAIQVGARGGPLACMCPIAGRRSVGAAKARAL
jgi:hypothetical protein